MILNFNTECLARLPMLISLILVPFLGLPFISLPLFFTVSAPMFFLVPSDMIPSHSPPLPDPPPLYSHWPGYSQYSRRVAPCACTGE